MKLCSVTRNLLVRSNNTIIYLHVLHHSNLGMPARSIAPPSVALYRFLLVCQRSTSHHLVVGRHMQISCDHNGSCPAHCPPSTRRGRARTRSSQCQVDSTCLNIDASFVVMKTLGCTCATCDACAIAQMHAHANLRKHASTHGFDVKIGFKIYDVNNQNYNLHHHHHHQTTSYKFS